ncbi:MAG TPA: putative metal-dependent hydrolase [Chryseosolibacter sp.]|nr:putative metal-dependent hydrolase [Chryseosolibacter sp.]
MSDDALKYPVGKFSPRENYSMADINQHINAIATLPEQIESLTKTFSAQQFNTPYREGGWTGLQVVHHLADSHMNAYIRFKWTLTEDTPTIKAYNEKLWAETPEVKLDPKLSIALLHALHQKWSALLKSLSEKDFQKQFLHPETKKHMPLDRLTAMYAWHGEHHLGHLKIIAGKPV